MVIPYHFGSGYGFRAYLCMFYLQKIFNLCGINSVMNSKNIQPVFVYYWLFFQRYTEKSRLFIKGTYTACKL